MVVAEFTIFFPGPPAVFILFMGVLALLMIYWAAKFIVSVYTGSGGS